jgi:hypothetical protein
VVNQPNTRDRMGVGKFTDAAGSLTRVRHSTVSVGRTVLTALADAESASVRSGVWLHVLDVVGGRKLRLESIPASVVALVFKVILMQRPLVPRLSL